MWQALNYHQGQYDVPDNTTSCGRYPYYPTRTSNPHPNPNNLTGEQAKDPRGRALQSAK